MIIATFQDSNQRQLTADSDFGSSDDEVEIVEKEKPNAIGWAYVGSHNFTPSAWGTLSGSNVSPILNVRSSFRIVSPINPVFQCSNYELGIVFPLRDEDHANRVACFERPPRRYNLKVDLPWVRFSS